MIQNPILRGFRPDPSVVRVGVDYYIATSTFEWWPGVQLHHSRDLVHWRCVGHALTRESQLNLRGIADSGGVWAPSLSHADGKFWLVYTNVRTSGRGRPFKDLGIYLVTAPTIEGPWSDPVALNSIGFDPSLFHDDDGRKWLVNMVWDFRPGKNRFAGIVVQEFDARAGRLVGRMTRVLAKDVLCEGPNLYKRNGWYYLLLAEGGTGWNHGISLARSRSVLGPYELDPEPAVLTTRDAPEWALQKAGHGELVATENDEWFMVHLASRPIVLGAIETSTIPLDRHPADPSTLRRCPLGRETCLQRVVWSPDGWLRLAGGGMLPQIAVAPPAAVRPKSTSSNEGESFGDKVTLGPEWTALRGPIGEDWASLTSRPGWLRLRGRESLHSLFFQSLLAQRVTEHRFVAETLMQFRPEHFTQAAGLICYYDTRSHYYLRVTHDESRGRVLGVVLSDEGVYQELGASTIGVDDWPIFHLRVEWNVSTLVFSASRDGIEWLQVGPSLDATKLSDDYGSNLRFTGALVGLCAQDLGGTGASADFAHFTLNASEVLTSETCGAVENGSLGDDTGPRSPASHR